MTVWGDEFIGFSINAMYVPFSLRLYMRCSYSRRRLYGVAIASLCHISLDVPQTHLDLLAASSAVFLDLQPQGRLVPQGCRKLHSIRHLDTPLTIDIDGVVIQVGTLG